MKRTVLLSFIFVFITSICIYAQIQNDGNETEKNYIVTLSENAKTRIIPMKDDMSVINEELNMYKTTKSNAMLLKNSGLTVSVEEDVPLIMFKGEYNDYYFNNQWQYDIMHIYDAQKALDTGNSTRIAVIDSGVYREHEELKNANIETGYNYIDSNTDTTDNIGHGTNVTGVIASTSNNSVGIAGVAPKSTVVPLQVMKNGEDVDGKIVMLGSASHMIKALTDAVDKYNCKIINMSVGIEKNLRSLELAVNYVNKKGAIIICAVGNEGKTEYTYPAAYDYTLGVGAVDNKLNPASFTRINDSVDVMAPGTNIYMPNIKGAYSTGSGTSYACPIVTSYAALLCQKYPDLTYDELLSIIKAATMDISELGKDVNSGYGVLDMYEGVKFYENKPQVFISPSNGSLLKYYFNTSNPVIKTTTVSYNSKMSSFNYSTINPTDNLYHESFDTVLNKDETAKICFINGFESFTPISNLRIIK